jgi:hypothetical protein
VFLPVFASPLIPKSQNDCPTLFLSPPILSKEREEEGEESSEEELKEEEVG